MPYEMTKRYICMVMIVIASLAVMAILVLTLGGRGTSNKARLQNDMTVSAERIPVGRHSRSPQQSTSLSESSVVDGTLYDVEDFTSDYKIIRLTKPNSKYYTLTYDTNDVASAASQEK